MTKKGRFFKNKSAPQVKRKEQREVLKGDYLQFILNLEKIAMQSIKRIKEFKI